MRSRLICMAASAALMTTSARAVTTDAGKGLCSIGYDGIGDIGGGGGHGDLRNSKATDLANKAVSSISYGDNSVMISGGGASGQVPGMASCEALGITDAAAAANIALSKPVIPSPAGLSAPS